MLGITYLMLYHLLNKLPLCILCHKMKVEKISTSQLLLVNNTLGQQEFPVSAVS